MKSTVFAFLLATALTVSTSFGWVGGPWSGNMADNTAGEGTYQGTIRGKNLSGVFFFLYSSSTAAATSNVVNNFYIAFHEGIWDKGNTVAVVDTEGRNVSGVFESSASFTAVTISPTDSTLGGAFSAKMTTTSPQIRFEGDGVMSSKATGAYAEDSSTSSTTTSGGTTTTNDTAEASWSSDTIDIKVSGVRTSSAPPSSATTAAAGAAGS